MNEALNGIPLNNSVHLGSHTNYDNKIIQRLNDFMQQNPNATSEQCYNAVLDLVNDVKTAINNNPTTHINQLNF